MYNDSHVTQLEAVISLLNKNSKSFVSTIDATVTKIQDLQKDAALQIVGQNERERRTDLHLNPFMSS